MLFQDLITFIISWMRGRRWKKVLLLAVPFAVILASVVGVGVAGWSQSHDRMVAEYMAIAEKEVSQQQDEAEPESNELGELAGEKLSPVASLAFRRVLRMESNNRAAFAVGSYLARSGDMATARQMMRKISPSDKVGYGPGHAWLAQERLMRADKLSEDELKILLSDLKAATEAKVATRAMIEAYAKTLLSLQRADEALAVLQSHVDDYPGLNVMIASIAKMTENTRLVDDSSKKAEKMLLETIQQGNASLEEFKDLVITYAISGNLEAAVKVGNVGLREAEKIQERTPQTDVLERELRRALSQSYLKLYQDSAKSAETGRVSVNLGFLDRALAVDSSNPAAVTEVARIVVQGGKATPEMVDKLKQNLAMGGASATTHLMLANYFLENGETNKAIPHLEQALERQPDNPIALNNLAYAISEDKNNLPRALELIDHAIRVTGPNPYMLDTKATILMRSGDATAAIVCYEDAIRLAPEKISYRERIAEAYEQKGMSDMAEIQLKVIKALKEKEANGAKTESTQPDVDHDKETEDSSASEETKDSESVQEKSNNEQE